MPDALTESPCFKVVKVQGRAADRGGMWRIGWTLLKGALPAITVATLIPLALFYAALAAGSVGWAIAVSVVYAYSVAGLQWLRRRRVSGMLIVTVLMASVKAITVYTSGHPTLYFAIPAAETAGFGLMFLATMFGAEPLVLKFARDLFPSVADSLAERRSLLRTLSMVWTVTYVGSGITTLGLLTALPLSAFLGAHTVTGWMWSGSGAVVTALVLRARAAGLLAELTGAPVGRALA